MKIVNFANMVQRVCIILSTCIMLALVGCNKSEDINPGSTNDATGRVEFEVIDYSPAPGQFINELPVWEQWMTADDIRAEADNELKAGRVISLGAWGGSVTLRLQKSWLITPEKNQFKVCGNAISTGAEPGLVYVMEDINGNQLPDDGEWLLIAPDNLNQAINVTVTYFRPATNATDERYIRWQASDGTTGYIQHIPAHHAQPYFPQWLTADEITFTGLRLPDNGHFDTNRGIYILEPIAGTADSYPNSSSDAWLNVERAVDCNGNRVELKQIDFIKIVTGVLQTNGTLGECSTEVSGIEIKRSFNN